DAGFVVLLYDHRNLGSSDGEPLQEIDPWRQILDMRHAITFMRSRKEVDEERIGLWGTSYSGGHVIVVAAMDRRVKCVVTQAFTYDGYTALRRRLGDEGYAAMRKRIDADYDARYTGAEPDYVAVSEPGTTSYKHLHHGEAGKIYPNKVTLRSRDLHMGYIPGAFVSRVAPTPMLMIVPDSDTTTPTDLQLKAFGEAGEPKKLLVIKDCEHYGVYMEHLETTAKAAIDWFNQHL
ncbi:MAG: alpha/beta hydrolase, partial [Rhizobiaceae bacterium]